MRTIKPPIPNEPLERQKLPNETATAYGRYLANLLDQSLLAPLPDIEVLLQKLDEAFQNFPRHE